MEHLITIDEFKELARPTSVHIDESEVTAYIRESEDMNIIPAIGYDRYKHLLADDQSTLSEDEKTLLSGGEYTVKQGCTGDAKTTTVKCHGLKTALAYYAYAKMLRSDGAVVARAGFMRHDDVYSSHVDDSKLKQYNDVMNCAEFYLGSCLAFIKSKDDTIKPVHGTRCRIHAIGD